MSRRDLVRPVSSLLSPSGLFDPSPFSLLYLESKLISPSPKFSCSLHSTPVGAKNLKRGRINRDLDKYQKEKGGG